MNWKETEFYTQSTHKQSSSQHIFVSSSPSFYSSSSFSSSSSSSSSSFFGLSMGDSQRMQKMSPWDPLPAIKHAIGYVIVFILGHNFIIGS